MPTATPARRTCWCPRRIPTDSFSSTSAWTAPLPVGHDLGQLLAGLCHAGTLPADRLPEISSAILVAHADGLAAEGHRATIDQIRGGYLSGLVLRSAFSAIPLERLAEPPTDQLVEHWADRLRMTRALLDLANAGNLQRTTAR